MTITVTALVAINSGEETVVKIELSDGIHSELQQHSILTSQYAELRIKKGEINKDKYDEIVRASNICSAYKKGISLLSYSSSSQKNLCYKLKSRGFDDEISTEAVSMLASKGYLDDDNACEREVQKCIKKLWGKTRIISHLYSKGFDDNSVKAVIQVFDNTDFEDNCKKLIERDYKRRLADAKTDKAAMTRLISALSRMGYSFHEIKSALSDIL